ncbi:site-specific tyrosine recombinase XerC [Marinobacterium sp. xm-d-530]|nr:site-specific tyrosine recombinase XerC [Marinobacterium sp. xm-d-530]
MRTIRMKYVITRTNKLYYQRAYPTKLRELAGKKNFTYSLGLSTEATDRDLKKAVLQADELFDIECRVIQNSNVSAYTSDDVDKLAKLILKKAGVEPDITETHQQYVYDPESSTPYFAAELILGEQELDRIGRKIDADQALTVEELARKRAFTLLVTKKGKRPVTLSKLWDEYLIHRGLDLNSRNGSKANRYWLNWLSIIGEQYATRDLNDSIAISLQDYADKRATEVNESSSVERELNDIIAALRFGSKKHRLLWAIERPYVRPTPKKPRKPLTVTEQKSLVTSLFLHKNMSLYEGRIATLILLYLQSGMMSSEVARLKEDDISLDSEVPYILIRNATKSEARKRLVPVVLGRKIIHKYLIETIEWLNRVTETTPSAAMKKTIRTLSGNSNATGHCLRHSFKMNAQASGADVLSIASIAGWNDSKRSVSSHLLNYGHEGIESSEVVMSLYEANKNINKHLISIENEIGLSSC